MYKIVWCTCIEHIMNLQVWNCFWFTQLTPLTHMLANLVFQWSNVDSHHNYCCMIDDIRILHHKHMRINHLGKWLSIGYELQQLDACDGARNCSNPKPTWQTNFRRLPFNCATNWSYCCSTCRNFRKTWAGQSDWDFEPKDLHQTGHLHDIVPESTPTKILMIKQFQIGGGMITT